MKARSAKKVTDKSIREELDRILQSSVFVQSGRLSRFLRYAVEHAITSPDETLKEYVIGTEVYDRKPPYHPSQDSIVRTEARRLRAKLKEYYESQGQDDAILIHFRPGNYVPTFRRKISDAAPASVLTKSSEDLWVEGPGMTMAVIPFLDISGQPLSSKLARAVTDELTHELMHTEGCRVVSGHSLTQLGAESAGIANLARRLAVQIFFEGTIREEDSQIRVTARIVNAEGIQLWSQRFDAQLGSSNLFLIPEQLASAVVSRVRPQQSLVRAAEVVAGPAILSVYPVILKGEALLEEDTLADVQAALVKFSEGAESVPAYARPFCGIAQSYIGMALHGAPKSFELLARAREAAGRALEIDPGMAEAHASMGAVEALQWRWKESEESFRKALVSQPSPRDARQYAMLLSLLGRFDEAWVYLEGAQQIDPFSSLQKVACARFFLFSGRYEEGLKYFEAPARYGAVPLEAQLYLALLYTRLGNFGEAKNLLQLAQRRAVTQIDLRSSVAEIYAICNDREQAEKIISESGIRSFEDGLSNYRQSLLAVSFGDAGKAITLLEAALADAEAELPFLAVDPRFDAISSRPQFKRLVERVRQR